MREYSIYWIRNEFCNRYYFRSGILFRFFKSCERETSNSDLISQFHYVTRLLPYTPLINHVQTYCSNQLELQIRGNQIEWNVNDGRQVIMNIHKKQINICCQYIQDAENMVFQPLRSFDPGFFVIEKGVHNYGWIAPIKKRNDVLNEQLLYSTL
jgi:hypothetical protein